MLDFDTARVELLTWYRLGNPSGTRAFERFYREWLAPQTKMIASRRGFRPDEVDDVLQRLAIAFADREKMSGLEANSVTFWHRRIKWELESARMTARFRFGWRPFAHLTVSWWDRLKPMPTTGFGVRSFGSRLDRHADHSRQRAMGRPRPPLVISA